MTNISLSTFLEEQLEVWQLAKDNYYNLNNIHSKSVTFNNFEIKVQHNPARIVSTGANTSTTAIKERACFLCAKNRPEKQKFIEWGESYQICVNPFPIFKEHFTVADKNHVNQSITGRILDMLELAKSFQNYTVFYNGPYSGASAPDHFHFQMAPRKVMPIEKDIANPRLKSEITKGVSFLKDYLRQAIIFCGENPQLIEQNLIHSLEAYGTRTNEIEPRMNLLCFAENNRYTLIFIPRTEHRPKEFFEHGEGQIMFSPGAVDMAGLIIAPRREDYERYGSAELLQQLFAQVSPKSEDIKQILNPDIYAH